MTRKSVWHPDVSRRRTLMRAAADHISDGAHAKLLTAFELGGDTHRVGDRRAEDAGGDGVAPCGGQFEVALQKLQALISLRNSGG